MDYVYVLHVELSNTEGSIRMTEWHKMTILREFVNHNNNAIFSSRPRKSLVEIEGRHVSCLGRNMNSLK